MTSQCSNELTELRRQVGSLELVVEVLQNKGGNDRTAIGSLGEQVESTKKATISLTAELRRVDETTALVHSLYKHLQASLNDLVPRWSSEGHTCPEDPEGRTPTSVTLDRDLENTSGTHIQVPTGQWSLGTFAGGFFPRTAQRSVYRRLHLSVRRARSSKAYAS